MNTRLVLIILLSLFLLLCFILRIMYNYDTKNNNKHNTTENFYNTNDNFNNLLFIKINLANPLTTSTYLYFMKIFR